MAIKIDKKPTLCDLSEKMRKKKSRYQIKAKPFGQKWFGKTQTDPVMKNNVARYTILLPRMSLLKSMYADKTSMTENRIG
jgi:hypothetical protein